MVSHNNQTRLENDELTQDFVFCARIDGLHRGSPTASVRAMGRHGELLDISSADIRCASSQATRPRRAVRSFEELPGSVGKCPGGRPREQESAPGHTLSQCNSCNKTT